MLQKPNINTTIMFNTSKNELFKLNDNYKIVHRRIKQNYKIEINKTDITNDLFKSDKLLILAGPQEKFTENEFTYLKNFINDGGKLMVLLGEGGENDFNTNINFLLEEYGMNINSDAVVRPHYYKYYHPKEVIISNGVVCETMKNDLLKLIPKTASKPINIINDDLIEFVYPFGATINVVKPSNCLLTTSIVAYPFNRPLIGYYCNEKNGKILSIGSGHMFNDKYINDLTNLYIFDYLLNILVNNDIHFSNYDFNNCELYDNKMQTDITYLSEQPKLSLVESIECDIPADFKKIFDFKLYSINNNVLRDVINTYEKLSIDYEPLKIIKPQFEIPLPSLQLAVFPPIFSDVAPPPLELYDLDESFSTERQQLTNLTNKCLIYAEDNETSTNYDKELEYFIRECGRIINITQTEQNLTAKEIIYNVAIKIANYKKLDKE